MRHFIPSSPLGAQQEHALPGAQSRPSLRLNRIGDKRAGTLVVGQFATDNTGRPADHRGPRGWSTSRDHQKEPRFARVWGALSGGFGSSTRGPWPRVSGTAHGFESVWSVLSVAYSSETDPPPHRAYAFHASNARATASPATARYSRFCIARMTLNRRATPATRPLRYSG